MVAPFALNTDVAALLTTPVFGILTAAFAHVESPANGIPMVIKLVVPFQLIRTVGLCFACRLGLFLGVTVLGGPPVFFDPSSTE